MPMSSGRPAGNRPESGARMVPTGSNPNGPNPNGPTPNGPVPDGLTPDGPAPAARSLVYAIPARPGAVVFALAAAAAMAGYGWTILGVARNPGDWLLVIPAVIVGIAALLWAAIADGRRLADRTRRGAAVLATPAAKPLALLLLIAAYALALPVLGFDGATPAFLAVALAIQGERRIWLVVLNALIGTALMIWVFHGLLMVRLPLSIL